MPKCCYVCTDIYKSTVKDTFLGGEQPDTRRDTDLLVRETIQGDTLAQLFQNIGSEFNLTIDTVYIEEGDNGRWLVVYSRDENSKGEALTAEEKADFKEGKIDQFATDYRMTIFLRTERRLTRGEILGAGITIDN